mmetsp:Transcript_16652/g.41206  ORF Transcript_16652/g.41206 Transcript_16652/m.41206 type:complete len:563 (-) Transcript_16652:1596-3284(-)
MRRAEREVCNELFTTAGGAGGEQQQVLWLHHQHALVSVVCERKKRCESCQPRRRRGRTIQVVARDRAEAAKRRRGQRHRACGAYKRACSRRGDTTSGTRQQFERDERRRAPNKGNGRFRPWEERFCVRVGNAHRRVLLGRPHRIDAFDERRQAEAEGLERLPPDALRRRDVRVLVGPAAAGAKGPAEVPLARRSDAHVRGPPRKGNACLCVRVGGDEAVRRGRGERRADPSEEPRGGESVVGEDKTRSAPFRGVEQARFRFVLGEFEACEAADPAAAERGGADVPGPQASRPHHRGHGQADSVFGVHHRALCGGVSAARAVLLPEPDAVHLPGKGRGIREHEEDTEGEERAGSLLPRSGGRNDKIKNPAASEPDRRRVDGGRSTDGVQELPGETGKARIPNGERSDSFLATLRQVVYVRQPSRAEAPHHGRHSWPRGVFSFPLHACAPAAAPHKPAAVRGPRGSVRGGGYITPGRFGGFVSRARHPVHERRFGRRDARLVELLARTELAPRDPGVGSALDPDVLPVGEGPPGRAGSERGDARTSRGGAKGEVGESRLEQEDA